MEGGREEFKLILVSCKFLRLPTEGILGSSRDISRFNHRKHFQVDKQQELGCCVIKFFNGKFNGGGSFLYLRSLHPRLNHILF